MFTLCMCGLSGDSSFLPQSKNMAVKLIGLSLLPLCVNGCVHGCLSCVLPCDGLAIRPGCTPPLARRPLEIGTSSPATLYVRSRYRKWMDCIFFFFWFVFAV
ncbi:hypothetical protein ILYODFUR_018448 [Ilyodon furcidens]|uniref:Secreted protein n=1 Tax=Ilyodon furcidens TaxID=33524 RepID=A0ABV0TJX3_9TELE